MRFLTVPLLLAALAVGASAQTLWQIGTPDNTGAEFAAFGDYHRHASTFPNDVTWEVGASREASDWSFIQPGPSDAWAGSREHPFRVRFTLPEPPKSVLRLCLDLVDVQKPVAATLLIDVNGQSGEFSLPAGQGDASLGDPANGKEQLVTCWLDPAALREGANELTIRVRGSWVLWDALWLEAPEGQSAAPAIESLRVEPTYLLKRLPGGQLANLVRATVRATGPAAIELDTVVGGRALPTQPAPGGVRFGDLRTDLLIPEITEPTSIRVTARAGESTATAETTLEPVRRWKIYVSAASHTDIGYTDLQERCTERHVQNTERAIELVREFPTFGWNLETSWQADEYLRREGPEERQALLDLARAGRIGIQANYLNMLTGLCSHEGLNRWLSYAYTLHRTEGVPFEMAITTDVPTQVWSIPTTLAAAGIRYYANGINNDRAYPFNRLYSWHPYWWEGPDGSRVLAYFSPGYAHGVGPLSSVASFGEWCDRSLTDKRDFPYDALMLYGLVSDNQPVAEGAAQVAEEWNRTYAYPEIVIGPYSQYMKHMEESYGDILPTIKGDPGVYWEDGAASSARETALNRESHERSLAGEGFGALAHRAAPERVGPTSAYDAAEMWRNVLLYDEHAWGAYNSISQPDIPFVTEQWRRKAAFAERASQRSGVLLDNALDSVASLVPTETGSLVLTNASSWPRESAVVEATLPHSFFPVDPVTLELLPAVLVSEGTREDVIRFRAPAIPAWGYLVCPLVAAEAPVVAASPLDPTSPVTLGPWQLGFSSETGAVSSLVDTRTGREWVDAASGEGIGEYLHVTGGDDSNIVSWRGKTPVLTTAKAANPRLRTFSAPGVEEAVEVTVDAPGCTSLVTTYRVTNGGSALRIENQLVREDIRAKEAVYFAFPLALGQPEIRAEIPNGVVRCGPDQLPGGCTEWFCTEHWVRATGSDGSLAWVSIDAPLFTVDTINRGLWPDKLEVKEGWLYSYAMNNYWHTNYKASQGGPATFRFVLDAAASDGEAARLGWQESMPVGVRYVARPQEGSLPATSASLITLSRDDVVVTAVKGSIEGDGLVVRLFPYAPERTAVSLQLGSARVNGAVLCTTMEEPLEPLAVRGSTVRIPRVEPLRPITIRID